MNRTERVKKDFNLGHHRPGGMFRAGLDIPDGETADNRTDIEQVGGGGSWFAIVAPSDDCGRTTADSNHDGDIDLRDFAVFQNCFSGPTG